MKWVIASIGLLAIIVIFSLAALDQRDVVWVDGESFCPHCRSEVERFSEVCPGCQRAFDWQSYDRECSGCLSEFDVRFFQHVHTGNRGDFHDALREKGATEKDVEDLDRYLLETEAGACGFCAGTGEWLAPGFMDGTGGADPEMTARLKKILVDTCPVCFGEKTCRLCDGDRDEVECGVEDSYRALRKLEEVISRLNTPYDPASAKERHRELRSFVRRYSGRAEIADLPSFDVPDASHMLRAIRRIQMLRSMLNGLSK